MRCASAKDLSSTFTTGTVSAPALTVSVTSLPLSALAFAFGSLADDDVDRDVGVGDALLGDLEAVVFELRLRRRERLIDHIGHADLGCVVAGERPDADAEADEHDDPEHDERDDQRAPPVGRRLVGGRPAVDVGGRNRRVLHRRGRGHRARADRRAGGRGTQRRHLGDQRGHGCGRERPAAPEAQEIGAQVVGGLIPVVRILRHRGEDDLLEIGRDVGIALRRRHRFFAHVPVCDGDGGVARERDNAGDHLVEHDAERVHVRAAVDREALRLLRGEVGGRAHHRPGLSQAVAGPRARCRSR